MKATIHEERGSLDHEMYFILLVDDMPLRLPAYDYRRKFGPHFERPYDREAARKWFMDLARRIENESGD